jgi:2-succinyl-5-enolpyruvyl-6-hydroxy-3-cyclohexene-1-carboxylate synthase
MKLSISRNTVWCDLFVQRLSKLGVKYACISPGSRSTPLTLAFASSNEIKTFPIVDERSSAFFALGLAKKSNTPVAVVTTSGTAVAELYPAIIEAFYQRIPLIICTADRPSFLQNSGANQTINQRDIYQNHIRFSVDAGLPDINKLNTAIELAEEAVRKSCFTNRGPVHINFPFEKPFEPKNYTDKIDIKKIDKLFKKISFELVANKQSKINFNSLSNKLTKEERGLILVGFNRYSNNFSKLLNAFSKKLGYPIYMDGSSQLRMNKNLSENTIENFTSFVRAKDFRKEFDPRIIIQFGAAPTSNILLEFFKSSKAEKIIINEFGDRNDPSLSTKKIFKFLPDEFCSNLITNAGNFKRNKNSWIDAFRTMNRISSEIKKQFIEKASFPFEGRIITELLRSLPNNSDLMISNSLPIRDTDFFASPVDKKINIFTNRGASGIDGINSTALGIKCASREKTFLLIGDLAFFHDLNGLHNSKKFHLPITVILIDNSGGGIFESLPIAHYKEFFKENFQTPLNIDFKPFIEGYGGSFHSVKSWRQFHRKLLSSIGNKTLTVLHLKTNAVNSKIQREKYWAQTAQEVGKYIYEIRNRRDKL